MPRRTLARSRCKLAQQQLQQRALAGAIGADDADALAAQDAGGEAAEYLAPIEGDADILGLEDQLAGAGGLLHGHVGLARPVAPVAALHAHLLQRAHAAFIAGAAGLDALADPHLFLRQPLVEQRVLARLVRELRGFLFRVVVVIAGPAAELPAVEIDDARGNAVDEGAVVADEQQRAAEFQQQLFQPLDGVDVQMVGGLVEQQQLGLHHQRARQQHAPAPAAGEILVEGIAIQ